jgi:hypothetical protein
MHRLAIRFQIIMAAAFLMISCGAHPVPVQPTPLHPSSMSPTLTGIPYTISYLSDPQIGNGHFQLANPGAEAVEVRIASATLHLADEAVPQPTVQIFDRTQGIARDEVPLVLAAGDTLDFSLSFAPVAFTSHKMSPVAVALSMRVGADTLSARCEITMEQRIPRR